MVIRRARAENRIRCETYFAALPSDCIEQNADIEPIRFGVQKTTKADRGNDNLVIIADRHDCWQLFWQRTDRGVASTRSLPKPAYWRDIFTLMQVVRAKITE